MTTPLNQVLLGDALLLAAAGAGRNYIGIEINPDYCKIAEDRLRQEELFG